MNLFGMQFLQCNYGTREEDQPICSLATIPAGILCLSLGKIQFQSYLWQSCSKAEKFYCVLSWLEALRGLIILVPGGFHLLGNYWLSWRAWGSRGWRCCDFLWAFRSDGAVPAHVIAVIGLQFAENNRGQNGKPAERDKRLVHSLNHLRRVRGKPIGDKERCN